MLFVIYVIISLNKLSRKEKSMKRSLRGLMVTIIFTLMICSSMLFKAIGKLPELEINGVFQEIEKPVWSFSSYLKGNYQAQYDEWFTQHFPERSYFVKSYSELVYRLFHKSPNKKVVLGNEGALFEKSYIEAYLGLGEQKEEDYYHTLVADLKYIQEVCKQEGKQFAVLITPSKAAYHPEYIPKKYFWMAQGENQVYTQFAALLQQNQIDYLDTFAYLKEIEDTIPVPIFPKTGTHWNAIVGAYASNGLIDFLNEKMGEKIPKIQIGDIQEGKEPFDPKDQDIYRLMNVLEKAKNETYYTAGTYVTESQEHKKSIFWEGGSFSWQMLDCFDQNQIFRNMDFIFYQQMIRQYRNNQPIDVNLNEENIESYLEKALLHKDVIILEVNQENIRNMGYGFPHLLRNYLEANGFPKENYQKEYATQKEVELKNEKVETEAIYEMDGFYGLEQEVGIPKRWMQKEGHITLDSDQIQEKGLRLVVDVPMDYLNKVTSKSKSLEISVNGQRIAEFVLMKKGRTEIIVPPERLGLPKQGKYEIHLRMNTVFQMKDYEATDDSREISLNLIYIGPNSSEHVNEREMMQSFVPPMAIEKLVSCEVGLFNQDFDGENYYHWMSKNSVMYLKDEHISSEGLQIKGQIFLEYFPDANAKVLSVYVNEQKVTDYTIHESGKFELSIPKEALKFNEEHEYRVYLELDQSFRDITETEDRELTVQLMYVGAPSSAP